MGRIKKDLTGLTFNRLTVLEEAGSDSSKNALWLCQCSCGNTKTIKSKNITAGLVKSCGCLRSETSREVGLRSKKLASSGMKYCGACKTEKPVGEFYPGRYLDGLAYSCIPCSKELRNRSRLKNLGHYAEYAREWRRKNPEQNKQIRNRGRKRYRFSQYGLTLESFNKLLNSQNGTCAICQIIPRDGVWHIDHNEDLGKIKGRRSILCRACNTGIGMFLHSPQILKKAIEYITLWNEHQELKDGDL